MDEYHKSPFTVTLLIDSSLTFYTVRAILRAYDVYIWYNHMEILLNYRLM